MTTSSAMARELSVLLGARIGSAEVPHVAVQMWPHPLGGWNIRATHCGDEVPCWCSTEQLTYPLALSPSAFLTTIADGLARMHHQRVAATPEKLAGPNYRIDVAFDPESAHAHHLRLYGHTRGLDPYSGMRAAPVDYSGHRFDPEAISRAAGAGMQAAQPGRPHLPPEYAWMADQPKRWAWAFPALMALLVGVAAGLIALHFLQHWNP